MEPFSHFSFFLHERLRKQKAPPPLINSHSLPRSTVLFILLFFLFSSNTIRSPFVGSSLKEAKSRKREGSCLLKELKPHLMENLGEKSRLIYSLWGGKRHIKKVIFGFNLPKGIMYPERFENRGKTWKEKISFNQKRKDLHQVLLVFFFFLIAHLSFAFAFDEPQRVPEAQRGGLFLSPK